MVDINNAVITLKKNFILPSRIESHIYRDPPRSYTIPKKERVSEGDVMYMTRPDGPDSDASRVNESIRYMPTSINPSVAINMINTNAGGSRVLHSTPIQASNPYKVEVVRPPLYPVESLNPLSRPRTHQTTPVTTNSGIPYGFNNGQLQESMDKNEIYDIIRIPKANGAILPPTAFYKLETPQILQISNEIRNNPLTYSATANLTIPKANNTNMFNVTNEVQDIDSYAISSNASDNIATVITESSLRDNKKSEVKDENLILDNISAGYKIIMYDVNNNDTHEIVGSIKDKDNISVTAALKLPIEVSTPNGCTKKIHDYTYKIVKTNASQDKLIISINQNDNIELDRNIPLYAATSNPCDTKNGQCNIRHDISGKQHLNSHTYTGMRDYAVSKQDNTINIPILKNKSLDKSLIMQENDRVYDLSKKFPIY